MATSWFITGTSSGLGRGLAERALARGDRVVATLRKAGALGDLAARYPETLHVLLMDLTDTPGMRAAVDEAFQRAGRIDVVVSNAGYGLVGAAEELTDAQIERLLATNLTGCIQLIRAVLPHLRSQGAGRIVQLSSEGGQIAYPAFSLYHASKWGIEGFVEAVAQEVKGLGIDFILVEPGPTATQFGAGVDLAEAMPAYASTPAGDVRRMLESKAFPIKGDADRTVEAMLRAIDLPNPPFRVALGSTAYEHIHAALQERLHILDAGRAEAYSADRKDVGELP